MDKWRWRINILIFKIKECAWESYFDTLNMTEDILRMKLKVGISSWRIQSVHRIGKERGGRLILVGFISFLKKLKVLHAPRNLAGTKIRIEQGEISRLIPYLRLQTTEKHNIPS